jgi:hypothetical protein
MNKETEHLETLTEIRSLMERSSRFISLSGLSGVCAGVFALAGATAAYIYLNIDITSNRYYEQAFSDNGKYDIDFFTFFTINAVCVLAGSLIAGSFFTMRKAQKKGQTIWDKTAQRLLINLMIPLVAGGVFCLILLHHRAVALIAPCTLIFYGLALINASKYTLNDIRYLGFTEIIIGLIASYFIGYGLLFWAIGFGVLHIVYGIAMYNKYEK